MINKCFVFSLKLASILITAGLAITLFSCSDNPTSPDEETAEYRLYVHDHFNYVLMSFAVPADTLVDSVRIDYPAGGIYVTAEGDRLLVTRNDYDTMLNCMEVYSTADFSYLGSLEKHGRYYFDGTDNYGICKTYESVYFLDPLTLAPTDSIDFDLPETNAIVLGYLDTVSNLYFCRTMPFHETDSSTLIFKIDCITRRVVDTIITPIAWGRLIGLSHNWLTNDLYFHAMRPDGMFLFQQLDLDGDTLVNSTQITGAAGSSAITPDGKKIIMTDFGDPYHGYSPAYPITILDAFTHQPISWIPPYDSTGRYVCPHMIYIAPLPDNSRAYIASYIHVVGIDLRTNRITNSLLPDEPYYTGSIALGPVVEE